MSQGRSAGRQTTPESRGKWRGSSGHHQHQHFSTRPSNEAEQENEESSPGGGAGIPGRGRSSGRGRGRGRGREREQGDGGAEKPRSRNRRPDAQIYVPRARRQQQEPLPPDGILPSLPPTHLSPTHVKYQPKAEPPSQEEPVPVEKPQPKTSPKKNRQEVQVYVPKAKRLSQDEPAPILLPCEPPQCFSPTRSPSGSLDGFPRSFSSKSLSELQKSPSKTLDSMPRSFSSRSLGEMAKEPLSPEHPKAKKQKSDAPKTKAKKSGKQIITEVKQAKRLEKDKQTKNGSKEKAEENKVPKVEEGVSDCPVINSFESGIIKPKTELASGVDVSRDKFIQMYSLSTDSEDLLGQSASDEDVSELPADTEPGESVDQVAESADEEEMQGEDGEQEFFWDDQDGITMKSENICSMQDGNVKLTEGANADESAPGGGIMAIAMETDAPEPSMVDRGGTERVPVAATYACQADSLGNEGGHKDDSIVTIQPSLENCMKSTATVSEERDCSISKYLLSSPQELCDNDMSEKATAVSKDVSQEVLSTKIVSHQQDDKKVGTGISENMTTGLVSTVTADSCHGDGDSISNRSDGGDVCMTEKENMNAALNSAQKNMTDCSVCHEFSSRVDDSVQNVELSESTVCGESSGVTVERASSSSGASEEKLQELSASTAINEPDKESEASDQSKDTVLMNHSPAKGPSESKSEEPDSSMAVPETGGSVDEKPVLELSPSGSGLLLSNTSNGAIEISSESNQHLLEGKCDTQSGRIGILDSKIEVTSSDAMETGEEEEEDDESWDTLFDDDGECLDPSLMSELTIAVGDVKVQKPQFDYYNYQPKDPDMDWENYNHVIEIYDFPTELITRDLLTIFKDFMSRGFDLKWVDDTHCLGVFASDIAARDALGMKHPLLKVRPIAAASKTSKVKARKCSEFLQPYKPRPETSACVARNLVAGALGLKNPLSRAKQVEERKKLKEAREKKRQARKQQKEVWDGRVTGCAMDQEN